MSYDNPITLNTLIDVLRMFPQDAVASCGILNPHSWRGDYSQIAFEPGPPMAIGNMLAVAEAVRGASMTGYKGGEYIMHGEVDVHLAHWGELGEPLGGSFVGRTALSCLD